MDNHINSIKAVLFDFDDTLVATKEIIWAHHKFVAEKFYSKSLTDEDILPHWGKPFPELVCLLYGTDDVQEAMANNFLSRDNFPNSLYKDTIFTIKHIHSLGKLIGIITAAGRLGFEKDIKRLRFPKEMLEYTQTAEESEFHKPDPRVFEPANKWLREKHISTSEVLYIGDGLHDMKAALDAGMQFLGVETGLVKNNQFKEQGATSVPDVSGVIKYLVGK